MPLLQVTSIHLERAEFLAFFPPFAVLLQDFAHETWHQCGASSYRIFRDWLGPCVHSWAPPKDPGLCWDFCCVDQIEQAYGSSVQVVMMVPSSSSAKTFSNMFGDGYGETNMY